MSEELRKEELNASESNTPLLSVSFGGQGSVCVLTLIGQLTRFSVAALDAMVDQIGSAECKTLILDIAAVTDLDAVGSRVLASLDVYVRTLGAKFTISGAKGTVAETLARTSMDVGGKPGAAVSVLRKAFRSDAACEPSPRQLSFSETLSNS